MENNLTPQEPTPTEPEYSFETSQPEIVNTETADAASPNLTSVIPGIAVGAANSGLTSINNLLSSGSSSVKNVAMGTVGTAIAGLGLAGASKGVLDVPTSEDVKDNFLPIGSIVKLKDVDKKVMVIGFCSMAKDGSGKVFDYAGCFYPEGYMAADKTCLFNNADVEEIIDRGFVDPEEKDFKIKLNSLISQIGTN